jgi:hypothetical protein
VGRETAGACDRPAGVRSRDALAARIRHKGV